MRKVNIKKLKDTEFQHCYVESYNINCTLIDRYINSGDKLLYNFKDKKDKLGKKKYYSSVFTVPKNLIIKQEGDFYLYPFKNIFGEGKQLTILEK